MGCHEKFCYIRRPDGQKHYYGVVIRKLLYNGLCQYHTGCMHAQPNVIYATAGLICRRGTARRAVRLETCSFVHGIMNSSVNDPVEYVGSQFEFRVYKISYDLS